MVVLLGHISTIQEREEIFEFSVGATEGEEAGESGILGVSSCSEAIKCTTPEFKQISYSVNSYPERGW